MTTGTIKFFNQSKGFGFISPEDGGKDVFVHISGIDDDAHQLDEGVKVTFDTEETKKGLAAIKVKIMDEGVSED